MSIQFEELKNKSLWKVNIFCIVDILTEYIIAENEEQVIEYLKQEWPNHYPHYCGIEKIVTAWLLDTFVSIK